MSMKNIVLILLFLLLFSFAASAQNAKPTPTPAPSPSPSPTAVDLTGKWAVVADAGGQAINILMEITQKGAEFTGVTTADIGGGKNDGGKRTGKSVPPVLHADRPGQAGDLNYQGPGAG